MKLQYFKTRKSKIYMIYNTTDCYQNSLKQTREEIVLCLLNYGIPLSLGLLIAKDVEALLV